VPPGGIPLPPQEALRIAAQLTDTEEDLHAITRVVLALVGADDDLTGAAAEAALTEAGIPENARRLLLAALGPRAGRPSVTELRTGLESAVADLTSPRQRTGPWGLLDELRRRRVTRTAFWYVAGSVAVVEAASLFLPTLGAPDGLVRLLTILAVCGLPVALTLSWVFDVSTAAGSRQRRWLQFAVVGGVILLSGAAAATFWDVGRDAPPTLAAGVANGADPAHIAVLGFTTVGSDETLTAFATQLQLRLIDGLSAAAASMAAPDTPRQMRVLSYAGVLPFARHDFAMDSLRLSRGIGTLLDGTIERTADATRVSIRLVDTRTGDQIHTSSAEVSHDDHVALVDAVADTVARMVRMRLGRVINEHMRLLETRSPAAFDHLMWAMHRKQEYDAAFNRADYDGAARVLAEVDSLLAAAERSDPRWTEPMVERGWVAKARAQLAHANGRDDAVVPEIQRGIRHTERALDMRDNDVRALQMRGELRRLHLQFAPPTDAAAVERLRDAARSDLRASLNGNPQRALPLRLLSELAGGAGAMQEGLDYGKRAYDEDPFMEQVQWTVFRLFEYSFALNRDAEAVRWCSEGRQRFSLPVFHDCRLALASWSDVLPLSPDSAWTLVAAELAAHPDGLRGNLEPRLHAMVAAVLVRNGLADSARAVLREARQRDSSIGMLRAATGVLGLLGEDEAAITSLRELVDRTPAALRPVLLMTPELRSILGDPRAAVLLAPPVDPGD
jgi:TolB-like protein